MCLCFWISYAAMFRLYGVSCQSTSESDPVYIVVFESVGATVSHIHMLFVSWLSELGFDDEVPSQELTRTLISLQLPRRKPLAGKQLSTV